MSGPPWMDIVMPTYNRPAAAVKALEALAALPAHGDIGAIVVDDGSEEPIEPLLPASLRDRLSIRILRLQNGGPARARNAGIAASQAEFIGFVDDDVRVDRGWLAAYREALAAEPGPVALFGPLALPKRWRPSPWIRWEAETLAVEYRRMLDGVYAPTWRQFFTGNAVVRRDLLERAGGFDESFTRAEDIELGLRLEERCGVAFRFVPGAIGWHYARRTLESWLRIPRAYGEYDLRIDAAHPAAGHRARITAELTGQRHRISRMARIPARNDALRKVAVVASTRAAIAADRLGANGVASRLLSFAYDAEYSTAFFRAAAEADARAQEPSINSPSTDGDYVRTR